MSITRMIIIILKRRCCLVLLRQMIDGMWRSYDDEWYGSVMKVLMSKFFGMIIVWEGWQHICTILDSSVPYYNRSSKQNSAGKKKVYHWHGWWLSFSLFSYLLRVLEFLLCYFIFDLCNAEIQLWRFEHGDFNVKIPTERWECTAIKCL